MYSTFSVQNTYSYLLKLGSILQVISWYSFVRSGWFIVSNYNQNPEASVLDINFLKMSLDECVKTSVYIQNILIN